MSMPALAAGVPPWLCNVIGVQVSVQRGVHPPPWAGPEADFDMQPIAAHKVALRHIRCTQFSLAAQEFHKSRLRCKAVPPALRPGMQDSFSPSGRDAYWRETNVSKIYV